jgi:hypothetical protein
MGLLSSAAAADLPVVVKYLLHATPAEAAPALVESLRNRYIISICRLGQSRRHLSLNPEKVCNFDFDDIRARLLQFCSIIPVEQKRRDKSTFAIKSTTNMPRCTALASSPPLLPRR